MSREVKVGAFVLFGLLALGLVVFLIGDERRLFNAKNDYRAEFGDVEGLRKGSEVRMGGVSVGSVADVQYSKEAGDAKVYVTVGVSRSEAARIRKDSVIKVAPKGLLGDKMITISVGSQELPAIPPGGTIKSEVAEDITAALGRLGPITAKVEKTVENLERATGLLADEELHEELKGVTRSLGAILRSLNEGQGYAARLLKDPAEAERLSGLVGNLERASGNLDRTLSEVGALLGQVKSGPGFAHEVLYGEEGARAVAQVGGAAEEVGLLLKGVREGDGLAKSLVYGGPASEDLTRNLTELSVGLNRIVADIQKGKGTLGALVVDPSVYEDLKLLLGNVSRNKALRALVRYSIQRDESTGSSGATDSVELGSESEVRLNTSSTPKDGSGN
jgi:phospholipid/cholesterol/gamma-HCH transport system substrate-binding protein